jgi:hypothetical protein
MRLLGLFMAVLGWLIAVSSVELSSTGVQALVAVLGILVTALGVFGALNSYHLKNAVWKGRIS